MEIAPAPVNPSPNPDVQLVMDSARNHVARVKEGRQLLAAGHSLAEMETSVRAYTDEAVKAHRGVFMDSVASLSSDEIKVKLEKVNGQIEKGLLRGVGGTSELEWRRNVLTGLSGNRR